MPGKAAKRAKPAQTNKKITEAEFHQHLLNIGLISSLPDPALDIDDDDPDDQPVNIKGEPLSETIIRERRRGVAPPIIVLALDGSRLTPFLDAKIYTDV